MSECNSSCNHFRYVNSIDFLNDRFLINFSGDPIEALENDKVCFRFSKAITLPGEYSKLLACAKIGDLEVPIYNKCGNRMEGSNMIVSENATHICQKHVYFAKIEKDNDDYILKLISIFVNEKDLLDDMT